MRRITSISVVFFALLLIAISSAQQPASTAVPNLIRYSGTLKEAQGTASVPSATAGVTFAIYKQQDGGAPVWMETQNVTTDAGGNYSVLLGSTTATGLPGDLFSQQEQRWLGVQMQGQVEQPRVLLVSVPYAFKAHEAETLGGKSVSDFVLAGANSAASANQAGISAKNQSQSTQPGTKIGAAGQGPTNFSGTTVDQIVGVTQAGTGAGVNATAPNNAVFGTATGAGGYAVYGIANGSGGIAVKGTSTTTTGTGVRGIETATTGSTIGVSAYVASATGTAAVLNNAGGGKIISGQNDAVEKFSVDGSGNVNALGSFTGATFNISGNGSANSFNATTSYKIGGTSVLSLGSPADNLFLGTGAGASSNGANYNVFAGYEAGNSNTSGSENAFVGAVAGEYDTTGYGNTFVGFSAGEYTTTGYSNTFIGNGAGLVNTSGAQNTFIGVVAGSDNTTGSFNTLTGVGAGIHNTEGNYNTFAGESAGILNTTGSQNTFTGGGAGYGNTTGSDNTFYGYEAGVNSGTGNYNTFSGWWSGYYATGSSNTFYGTYAGVLNETGNNNIYIGNLGATESNTIRIGGDLGLGYGSQTAAYIAGVYGATSSSGIPVYINSSGQLGTQTSSRRFKEQIADMGDSTSKLFELRPVTFFYKPQYDDGSHTLQYGLIAEEVAKVYPELVAYDNDGQPYTVRYQYITTMLLNEVQKQYHRVEADAGVITAQEQKINELEQRLSRLETLVGAQVKIAEGAARRAGTQ